MKGSFSFASEIGSFPNDNYIIASFDVKTLFTNIPIQETIDIISNKIFTNNNVVFTGYDRKLLEICTKDNIFLCNNQLYKQEGFCTNGRMCIANHC